MKKGLLKVVFYLPGNFPDVAKREQKINSPLTTHSSPFQPPPVPDPMTIYCIEFKTQIAGK